MAEIFKLQVEGTNYTFYRASLEDGMAYFILYSNSEGTRESVRVRKNENGRWEIESHNAPQHIRENTTALISAIAKNEAGYSPE